MTTYYCHKCQRNCQTRKEGDELKCTLCNDSFVEERQVIREDRPPSPVEQNPFGMFPASPFANLFAQIAASASQSSREPRSRSDPNIPSGSSNTQQRQQYNPRGADTRQGRGTEEEQDPMANFLQQILTHMVELPQRSEQGSTGIRIGQGPSGAISFQIVTGPGRNLSFNPSDYAWGANGLDNIMTTLLNQFDEAQEQARALRPEDIARLPMTKTGQHHVDNGAQCTTCMETFQPGEDVAKLNCEHIFHRQCIVPWLQRNNTCPICRTQVDPREWSQQAGGDEKEQASSGRITDIDELD